MDLGYQLGLPTAAESLQPFRPKACTENIRYHDGLRILRLESPARMTAFLDDAPDSKNCVQEEPFGHYVSASAAFQGKEEHQDSELQVVMFLATYCSMQESQSIAAKLLKKNNFVTYKFIATVLLIFNVSRSPCTVNVDQNDKLVESIRLHKFDYIHGLPIFTSWKAVPGYATDSAALVTLAIDRQVLQALRDAEHVDGLYFLAALNGLKVLPFPFS